MYEKYTKYKYDTGPLGYWLLLTCVVYIFGFSAYYATVYVNLGTRVENDEMLNKLMIWNALKPALAVLILIWIIFSLFDAIGIFLLIVPCMVVFFGSFAMTIKLLIDRYSTCNSSQTPHNICNDPLYCCAYFDVVSTCSGLGPCPGSNVTIPSDLIPNDDLEMFGIFAGIFFFLELFLILLAMGVLSRLKRLKVAAILTNKMLMRYYETGEDEEEEEEDDIVDDVERFEMTKKEKGEDENGNEDEPEMSNAKAPYKLESKIDDRISNSLPLPVLGLPKPPVLEPRERESLSSSSLSAGNRTKRIIKSNLRATNQHSQKAKSINPNVTDYSFTNRRNLSNPSRRNEVRISIDANINQRTTRRYKQQRHDENDRSSNCTPNGIEYSRGCEKCGDNICFNIKHHFDQFKSSCFGMLQKISSRACSIYYYGFYHLNTFTVYELRDKKDANVIYLTKKRRRKHR